ncbi:MAG: hypothetical protein ACOYLQ_14840 [Hyphomicrobiaceae bacterium]
MPPMSVRTSRQPFAAMRVFRLVPAAALIRALVCGLAIAAAAAPGRANDLAGMYPPSVLAADAARLENAVRKICTLGLAPTLTADEKARLDGVILEFPMPQPGDDPLNFYATADAQGRPVVVMPILSLKALEDMATAYAWVHKRGLRASTIDLYYAMLRHRPADRFAGGRYPDILTALAIPKNANDDAAVDRLSLSIRNEAFAFILGHELGHILFRHKGYGEVTRQRARDDEVQSDRFALDVMARSATPPLGAVLYFQAQVYRFRHRGEFPTPLAFDDYLMTVATHPMTVDRIDALARHISGPLADRRGRERAIWVGIGQQLGQVASLLRDGDLARCIARVAADAPLEALLPGRTDHRWAMEQACR